LMYSCFLFFDKQIFFFDYNYLTTNFIILFKLLLLFISLVFLLLCYNYFEFQTILKSFEFSFLMLLSLVGMFLLLSCCDFLSLYLSLELQTIVFYILTSYKQSSLLSIEAGLKYFILGSLSSGLMLLGISLIYFFTGLINFYELYIFFQNNSLIINNN